MPEAMCIELPSARCFSERINRVVSGALADVGFAPDSVQTGGLKKGLRREEAMSEARLILPNPRHEKFAQLLAQGNSAAAAYVEAGYKSNRIMRRH